ncbi:ATP-binding protein [Rubrivivax sp. RP6-9]|uniref:ATP-binding protein n=1 Tax=Rubrivivax sp. RP6-9 TaxID=3415750 RepID=UPI003CC66772
MNHRILSFGNFELRPAERVLMEGDRPVPLGNRALDILTLLVARAGQVIGKDELIAGVWPSSVVEEATLRVHIASLRRCLRDGRSGHRFIVNVTGRGYSFVAPVKELHCAESLLSAPSTAPTSSSARALSGLPFPLPVDHLLGRDESVAALLAKILLRRFVTVVGAGGVGKTALALHAASVLSADLEHVVYVDLAPVQQPALVPSVLASALGITALQDDPSGEVADCLASCRVLLILDSCERVLDAVAQLSERVFPQAPGLHILATSREPLLCAGEHITRLGPLDVPSGNGPISAAQAAASPAVQLFLERAGEVSDNVRLDDESAAHIVAICRYLDGVPLAIELAAAQVGALGLQGLQCRLHDRLCLHMTSGRDGVHARHQTLYATMEWSYGLLSAPQQLVFRRVSAFVGRFSLPSLLAVVCGEDLGAAEAAFVVADLVDKSLLVAEVSGEVVLYRLLDTTRAFARERLAEAGETVDISRRHVRLCHQTFEGAARDIDRMSPAEWLSRYAAWLGDVRAALDWTFESPGEERQGALLTVVTAPLWDRLMLLRENQANIERALIAPAVARDDALTRSLFAALGATVSQANLASPKRAIVWSRVLAMAERCGDLPQQLQSLWGLWVTELNMGHFQVALGLARRFRLAAENTAVPNDVFVGDRMVAHSLHLTGDQIGARRHIERMLAGYEPTERPTHVFRYQFDQLVIGLITLAMVQWVDGEQDAAIATIEKNVSDALRVGHALSLCNALIKSCCPVALLSGRIDLAQRYVDLLVEHTTAPPLFMWQPFGRCYQGLLQLARGELDAGRVMVRHALAEMPHARFAVPQSWVNSVLALADAECGAVELGMATIDQTIDQARRDHELWCLPELLRVRGEVLRVRGEGVAARAAVQQALALARKQGAHGWTRRAEISLRAFAHRSR